MCYLQENNGTPLAAQARNVNFLENCLIDID
jgi:hypothetical protein